MVGRGAVGCVGLRWGVRAGAAGSQVGGGAAGHNAGRSGRGASAGERRVG